MKSSYFTWTLWTALVHASCMVWTSQWALICLHVIGPVLLSIGPGSPMSPGGMSYSESPESGSISSCWWGRCYMHKSVSMDYPSLPLPLLWFNSAYWEIWLLPSNHIFSIFPAMTYLMFTPKYFLSYQAEIPLVQGWRLSFSGRIKACGG